MNIMDDVPEYEPGKSSLNRTERAFMAREVNSSLARSLRQDGWTLAKLQQEDDAALDTLGLSSESIALIRAAGRPAIPSAFLIPTLIANRFTCCVCHDPEASIIVHHIEPWAESHDHTSPNLAVLCERCHVRAHTKSELTRNLDAPAIIAAKAAWEDQVKSEDALALRAASRANYDAWWYFNHSRLFELAKNLNIPLAQYCRQAVRGGLATTDGMLIPRGDDSRWMYEGSDGQALYNYVTNIFNAVVERLRIYNISNYLDVSVLDPLLRRGDFIYVQGAHQFSPATRQDTGISQLAAGRRRANGVEVQFRFDLWEATSASAHGYLRGRRAAGSLIRIVDLSRADGLFIITGSVLAIAAPFSGFQEREYGGAFPTGLIRWASDDDTDDDQFA